MSQWVSSRRVPGFKGLAFFIAAVIILGLSPAFNGAALAFADEKSSENTAATVEDNAAVTVYRLYNQYSGEHLFTSDGGEKNALTNLGWTTEGVGWKAPKTIGDPIYRLFNPFSSEHLYTTDKGEYDFLDAIGWNGEGISYHSSNESGKAAYRLYNPYGSGVTAHHFTTDSNERAALTSLGYKDEGICWYGLPDIVLQDDVQTVSVNDWGTPNSSGYISSITVPETEGAELKVGQTIVAEANDEHPHATAIVVSKVTKSKDGYVVSGRKPKMEDVIDRLNIAGTTSEMQDVKFAKGVSLASVDGNDPSVMTLSIDPEELGISVDEPSVADNQSGSIPLGEQPIDVAQGIKVTIKPSFDYDVDYHPSWTLLTIDKAKLVANLDTKITFTHDFTPNTHSLKFKIFESSFPVSGTLGLVWINAEFSLVASVEGKLTLEAVMHQSTGIEYANEKLNPVCDSSFDLTAEFDGTAKGGVRPAASLTVFDKKLAYADIEGSVGIDASLIARSSGLICTDAAAYFYADVDLNRESNLLGDLLNKVGIKSKVTLADRSTSSLFEFHTENGKRVDHCTANAANEIFGKMAGNYIMVSGGGSWSDEMTLNGDGTFNGFYHDSDDGFREYYQCEYQGKFGPVTKIDDYTYKTNIESLTLTYQPGTTWINEYGATVICTEPYGMNDGGDIYFFLSGKPMSSVPKGYQSWMHANPNDPTLQRDGVYNTTPKNAIECGFIRVS